MNRYLDREFAHRPPTRRRAAYGLAWSLTLLCIMHSVARPQGNGNLVTALSTHTIMINEGVFGTQLAFFAALRSDHGINTGPADLIILIEGPKKTFVARKRERVAGLWLNSKQVQLNSMSAYQILLTTRIPTDIANADLLESVGIPSSLYRPYSVSRYQPGEKDQSEGIPPENTSFLQAFFRIMRKRGQHIIASERISVLAPGMFRGHLTLPPSLGTGTYTVKFFLFAQRQILDHALETFEVIRSGFDRMTYELSRNHPWFYGVSSLLILLAIGGLGHVMLRRN